MLRDVVVVVFRRRAHAPAIDAASLFDHKNRLAWAFISMHACGSVPIVTGLGLTALPLL